MSSSLRPLAVFSLLSALASVVFAPGCSRQAEGERCDTANGDSDCDDGLKCTSQNKLQSPGMSDRCCDPDGTTFSDSRCQPKTNTGGTGGSSSTEAGAPSSAGQPTSAAGESSTGGMAGAPVVIPDDGAGAGGLPATTGGMPTTPEAGAPNGGLPATPAGGQGGSD
jgi:hypothetical protein